MFIRSGYSAHTRSARGRDWLAGARSGTEQRHLAADVLERGRDRAAALAPQPGLLALGQQLRHGESVELDRIELRLIVTGRAAPARAVGSGEGGTLAPQSEAGGGKCEGGGGA